MLSQADNASEDPNAVPSGGILIPTLGVGGHCLPKDGILLWWRGIESGLDTSNSIILKSRNINDESPAETIKFAEETFGSLDNKSIALLGTAYRFNSEDTRNSPTLSAANLLIDKNCKTVLHDPYVKEADQNLIKYNLEKHFTNDLSIALQDAEYIIICTAHESYLDGLPEIIKSGKDIKGLIDACNIYSSKQLQDLNIPYIGIGRGTEDPSDEFISFVYDSFQVMETGLANELSKLIIFLNENYIEEEFNQVDFKEVQRLAASCSTGCQIAHPGPVNGLPSYEGFSTRLAECAVRAG